MFRPKLLDSLSGYNRATFLSDLAAGVTVGIVALPLAIGFGIASGVTAQAWNLTWFSVVGSNIFSNVPFVLVAGKWIANFARPELMWKVLATTLAGNLTILGSVANINVVESARGHIEVGFWDYAKLGIPITVLTTAAGVALLLLIA